MATENGPKVLFSQSYKHSKYSHEMALLSLFYETASLFWFSLFLLSLSGFWPFSFKPPRAALGGVKINIENLIL